MLRARPTVQAQEGGRNDFAVHTKIVKVFTDFKFHLILKLSKGKVKGFGAALNGCRI